MFDTALLSGMCSVWEAVNDITRTTVYTRYHLLDDMLFCLRLYKITGPAKPNQRVTCDRTPPLKL